MSKTTYWSNVTLAINEKVSDTTVIAPEQCLSDQMTDWPRAITLWDWFTLYSLCIGAVLVVLFDWLGTFEYISMDVSKYARAFLLVVFAIYIIRTGIRLSEYDFRFGRVFTYFIVLCLVYSIMSEDVVGNLYYTSRLLFWTLGTVVAYRLFIAGLLTEKIFRRMIITTVLLGAIFTIVMILGMEPDKYDNASAYLLLWCMPLLFLIKKSWIVNICITIAAIAIIMTVKRGAIIGLLFSIVVYGLIYLKMHFNMRTFINLVCALLVLVSIGAYVISPRWDFIEKRFEERTGSGRDFLFSILVKHYIQADTTTHILGFGINSVQRYTGQIYRQGERGVFAHSDWLQFMYDFGVFGILFLVWLHLQFLALIFKHYKNNSPHAPPLIMGYVIMFLINIYSGQLMFPTTIYLGLLWAISPLEDSKN